MMYRLLLWVALLGWPLSLSAADSEANARKLLNSLGCKACHSFEGSGSTLAPPLDGIGRRFDRQQLLKRLQEHTDASERFMPDYSTLEPEDMDSLLEFLAVPSKTETP